MPASFDGSTRLTWGAAANGVFATQSGGAGVEFWGGGWFAIKAMGTISQAVTLWSDKRSTGAPACYVRMYQSRLVFNRMAATTNYEVISAAAHVPTRDYAHIVWYNTGGSSLAAHTKFWVNGQPITMSLTSASAGALRDGGSGFDLAVMEALGIAGDIGLDGVVEDFVAGTGTMTDALVADWYNGGLPAVPAADGVPQGIPTVAQGRKVYASFAAGTSYLDAEGGTKTGAETGGTVTKVSRPLGLNRGGLSLLLDPANLAGSVGAQPSAWTDAAGLQVSVGTTLRTIKGLIDETWRSKRCLAFDQNTLAKGQLASGVGSGVSLRPRGCTLYLAIAPRAYKFSTSDTNDKGVFSSGIGSGGDFEWFAGFTKDGYLKVWDAAGAPASVASSLIVPCSPVIVAIRLSATSGTPTNTPTGVKFFVGDWASEAVASQLGAPTIAVGAPGAYNSLGGRNTTDEAAVDIFGAVISSKPDSDAEVATVMAALASLTGIPLGRPEKVLGLSADSHSFGNWATRNRNIAKRVWNILDGGSASPRPFAVVNFAEPGRTMADALADVASELTRADVLALGGSSVKRLAVKTVGANDLSATSTSNAAAIDTDADSYDAALVAAGWQVLEIEPMIRATYGATARPGTGNEQREDNRAALATLRSAAPNIARYVALPSTIRPWALGSQPSNATITGATGTGSAYWEATLDSNVHLDDDGFEALVGSLSVPDSLASAIRGLLPAGTATGRPGRVRHDRRALAIDADG